jgi:K+-sensing histidine kinase KdpD
MLLASQIEAGGYNITKEEIDFTQLVNECIHDFALRFPHHKIDDSIEEEIFLNGDQLLLQIGINNLLDNAIKYSPKESPIMIQLYQKGGEIYLSVKDEGKGINDDEKKALKKLAKSTSKSISEIMREAIGLWSSKRRKLCMD